MKTVSKVDIPNEREERILRGNGMDPREYGVLYREDTVIHLLCYKTRDTVVIRKGDRPWKQ